MPLLIKPGTEGVQGLRPPPTACRVLRTKTKTKTTTTSWEWTWSQMGRAWILVGHGQSLFSGFLFSFLGASLNTPSVPVDAGLHPKGGKKKKGKGKKKNKPTGRISTPSNPGHTLLTSGYTSTLMAKQDPCTTTHEHYCVHGTCIYIDGLAEPVCT